MIYYYGKIKKTLENKGFRIALKQHFLRRRSDSNRCITVLQSGYILRLGGVFKEKMQSDY